MIVERKRGDTKPVNATLTRAKRIVPLTGTSIRWLMEPAPGSNGISISSSVQIVDAAKGKVRWSPTAEEVAEAGTYRAEFEVTFGDGVVETFPDGEYIDVVILPDVRPTGTPGHFSDSVVASAT